MDSRTALAGICLVVGLLVGAFGYASYRGDFQQGELAGQDESKVEPVAAAPSPATEALPELPISLSYHENRLGRGYVVQIHNQSQKHMAVVFELENTTLEQEQGGALQLAPGELREIGAAQGWTFVSGETIRIRHDGYQTASLTIP